MAYGITAQKIPEEIAIDLLAYMYWCNDWCKNDGEEHSNLKHKIIIADDLVVNNGIELNIARELGKIKKRKSFIYKKYISIYVM